MKYYTLSEKGRGRNVNEDSFLVEKNSTHFLFAVADGVGGLQYGNVASTYATAELKKLFIEGKTNLETCFHIINSNMVSDNFEKNRTMASTLTAVLVERESHSCEIAHIGDSRAYIINESI
jgi:protein phosphatase